MCYQKQLKNDKLIIISSISYFGALDYFFSFCLLFSDCRQSLHMSSFTIELANIFIDVLIQQLFSYFAEKGEGTPAWASDITPSFLSSVLRFKVENIEFSATRILEQSNCAVLHLNDGFCKLFLKRSSPAWLLLHDPCRSEKQQTVSLASFSNEIAFSHLTKSEAESMRLFGCAIPHVYWSSSAFGADIPCLDAPWKIACDNAALFTVFFQYLEPNLFKEGKLYTRTQTAQALSWLASFHSYFWCSDYLNPCKFSGLFSSGCWWLSSFTTIDFSNLADVLSFHLSHLPSYSNMKSSGELHEDLELARWASRNSSSLFAAGNMQPARTFLHGDAKTSNMFFFAEANAIVAFDFQWAGLGSSGYND